MCIYMLKCAALLFFFLKKKLKNLFIIQEFVEARRTAGLNNAPPCSWSASPPQELREVPVEAITANAGFVTFGNSK